MPSPLDTHIEVGLNRAWLDLALTIVPRLGYSDTTSSIPRSVTDSSSVASERRSSATDHSITLDIFFLLSVRGCCVASVSPYLQNSSILSDSLDRVVCSNLVACSTDS